MCARRIMLDICESGRRLTRKESSAISKECKELNTRIKAIFAKHLSKEPDNGYECCFRCDAMQNITKKFVDLFQKALAYYREHIGFRDAVLAIIKMPIPKKTKAMHSSVQRYFSLLGFAVYNRQDALISAIMNALSVINANVDEKHAIYLQQIKPGCTYEQFFNGMKNFSATMSACRKDITKVLHINDSAQTSATLKEILAPMILQDDIKYAIYNNDAEMLKELMSHATYDLISYIGNNYYRLSKRAKESITTILEHFKSCLRDAKNSLKQHKKTSELSDEVECCKVVIDYAYKRIVGLCFCDYIVGEQKLHSLFHIAIYDKQDRYITALIDILQYLDNIELHQFLHRLFSIEHGEKQGFLNFVADRDISLNLFKAVWHLFFSQLSVAHQGQAIHGVVLSYAKKPLEHHILPIQYLLQRYDKQKSAKYRAEIRAVIDKVLALTSLQLNNAFISFLFSNKRLFDKFFATIFRRHPYIVYHLKKHNFLAMIDKKAFALLQSCIASIKSDNGKTHALFVDEFYCLDPHTEENILSLLYSEACNDIRFFAIVKTLLKCRPQVYPLLYIKDSKKDDIKLLMASSNRTFALLKDKEKKELIVKEKQQVDAIINDMYIMLQEHKEELVNVIGKDSLEIKAVLSNICIGLSPKKISTSQSTPDKKP